MALEIEKRAKAPEIPILRKSHWDEGKEAVRSLAKEQHQELTQIMLEFVKEQPPIIKITEDVFRKSTRVRIRLPEETPKLRQIIATLEVLESPELMKAIRDHQQRTDEDYKEYDEIAKELGLS